MKEWFRKHWVEVVLALFVGAVLAASATIARADSVVLFEGGSQYLRGTAGAVVLTVSGDGPRDANIECGMFLVGGTPEQPNGVLGAQCQLVDGFGRLDLGLGVAYLNTTSHLIGSHLNASLMLRYRFNRDWFISVRHWSNAGTTEENTGLDLITIGRKFK